MKLMNNHDLEERVDALDQVADIGTDLLNIFKTKFSILVDKVIASIKMHTFA